jgi:hypothetical protein
MKTTKVAEEVTTDTCVYRVKKFAYTNPHAASGVILALFTLVGFVVGTIITYGVIIPALYQWPLESNPELNPRVCHYEPNFYKTIEMNEFTIKFTTKSAYDLLDQSVTVNQYQNTAFTYRSRLEDLTQMARDSFNAYANPTIFADIIQYVPLVLTKGYPGNSDWSYSGQCAGQFGSKLNNLQTAGCVYTQDMETELGDMSDNTFLHEYAHAVHMALNPDGTLDNNILKAYQNAKDNVSPWNTKPFIQKYENQPYTADQVAGGFWYAYANYKEYFACESAGYLNLQRKDTWRHTWPITHQDLYNEDYTGFKAVNDVWTISDDLLHSNMLGCSKTNPDTDYIALVWVCSTFVGWTIAIPFLLFAYFKGWFHYNTEVAQEYDIAGFEKINSGVEVVSVADADNAAL